MKTLFAAAILLATAATAAGAATLQATAGLGGVAKAGRWTLLAVSLDNTADALDADLDVVWGDTHLRRRISLAPGVHTTLELYLRTSDAQGAIDVRLFAGGQNLAAIAVPVRILGSDDPVILCVLPDAAAADSGGCTATALARDLPRSPRGYEVADQVTWPAGRAGLSPDQDAALRAWQSLKGLDASGDLGLTPQVSRPLLARGLPQALAPVLAATSVVYLVAVTMAGAMLRARRARLSRAIGVYAGLTLATCGAIAGIGRVGSTRAVHLHHVSLLQQLPGTDDSVLTMRGIAEFPAFDTFSLRLPLPDAMIATASRAATTDQIVDAEGFPVVTGLFGLAGRQSFAGEAVVRLHPLSISEHGRQVDAANESGVTLRDCRFGRGLSPGRIGTLAPGQSVSAAWAAGAAEDEGPSGPLISCAMDDAPVPLTETSRPVVMHGTTTVVAYRQPILNGTPGD
jgi:hypothetical protein